MGYLKKFIRYLIINRRYLMNCIRYVYRGGNVVLACHNLSMQNLNTEISLKTFKLSKFYNILFALFV